MKNKKEVISYLFFGVLATVINVICFQLFGFIFGDSLYLLNNILSWIITIIFAFFTNKLWVFESGDWSFAVLKGEVLGFLSARIFSLVLEELGLYVMIDIMELSLFRMAIFNIAITGELISKVAMQVIVVLVNYVLSKFVIFKKKQ